MILSNGVGIKHVPSLYYVPKFSLVEQGNKLAG